MDDVNDETRKNGKMKKELYNKDKDEIKNKKKELRKQEHEEQKTSKRNIVSKRHVFLLHSAYTSRPVRHISPVTCPHTFHLICLLGHECVYRYLTTSPSGTTILY